MGAPRFAERARGDATDLVYGEVDKSLVFIPREQALELAAVWSALTTSSTWGEFRSRLPARRCEDLFRRLAECIDELPHDDDPFTMDDIPGVSDGDYPEWPAQEMLKWLPKEIVAAAYGKIETSRLNGLFLTLDPGHEPEIVEALRAAGSRCTKDQQLVLRACGFGG